MTQAIPRQPERAKANFSAGVVHEGRFARWLLGLGLVGGVGGVITALMMIGLVLADLWGPRNSAVVFGFGRCGDAPCFRGLIPGLTPWTEARAAFGDRVTRSIDAADGEIRLYESVSGGTLGRMTIRMPADGSFLIGHLINLYGAPCGLTIYPQAGKFSVRYATARFVTPTNQPALGPNTPVVFVEFGYPATIESMDAQPCFPERHSAEIAAIDRIWHGFASLPRYLSGW